MRPYTFTENRPLMINEDQADQAQQPADTGQDEALEASYPRDLNKRGLLISLGISLVVVGLLIVALV